MILTSGDYQFLTLVAKGHSDEEIARRRTTTLQSARKRRCALKNALLPHGTPEQFIVHLNGHVLPEYLKGNWRY